LKQCTTNSQTDVLVNQAIELSSETNVFSLSLCIWLNYRYAITR
jgi:hypothetical protein